MKRIYSLIALAALLLMGCEKAVFDEEQGDNVLLVTTRANGSTDINYPITVFAFDAANNKCVSTQNIQSANESLALSLNKGAYRLSAWTGLSGTTLTQMSPAYDANFSLINNLAETQLLCGQSDVSINSSQSSASITLRPAVAQVTITLQGLPATVTGVEVTLSSQYQNMSVTGNGSGSASASKRLNSTGSGTWTSGSFYVLPTNGTNATISIAVESAGTTTTMGYSLNTKLEAGTPYNITGNYDSDTMTLSGQILAASWNAPQNINFNFGSGGGQTPEPPVAGGELKAGSAWNGHVVALDTGNGTYLLLGRGENFEMPSALNEEYPTEAMDWINEYKEDDLTDWRVPTKDEAKLLRDTYGTESALAALNDVIESCGGEPVSREDDGGNNARYLCEDATYTFSFKSGTSTTKAGTKQLTYYLRAVKTIKK